MIYNILSYEELLTTIVTGISRRKAKGTDVHGGVSIKKASAAGAINKNRVKGIQGGRVNMSYGERDADICWVFG